jgi:hypothetical protein
MMEALLLGLGGLFGYFLRAVLNEKITARAEARRYRPEHLKILRDALHACSRRPPLPGGAPCNSPPLDYVLGSEGARCLAGFMGRCDLEWEVPSAWNRAPSSSMKAGTRRPYPGSAVLF